MIVIKAAGNGLEGLFGLGVDVGGAVDIWNEQRKAETAILLSFRPNWETTSDPPLVGAQVRRLDGSIWELGAFRGALLTLKRRVGAAPAAAAAPSAAPREEPKKEGGINIAVVAGIGLLAAVGAILFFGNKR